MGYHFEELLTRAEMNKLLPTISDMCVGGVISRRGWLGAIRRTPILPAAGVCSPPWACSSSGPFLPPAPF